MVSQQDKEFLIAFGKQLKKLRMSKNITQKQLAFELDVEISQVSRIERGIINTSLLNLKQIADALEIPIEKLFEFYKTKTP